MENSDNFQMNLENWLHEIIRNENPSEDIVAFRFGLGEAEDGYVLYLAGSKNYDEADDEWAADSPDFLAEKELVVSSVEEQEWYWVLLKVIYSLGRVLRKSAVNTFLRNDRPVYVGFEDGDLYRIK